MRLFQVDERLDVKMCKLRTCTFDDVDMSGASFENVNLSGARMTGIDLTGLRITRAKLAGVAISEADLDGMTIEGIPVTDLLAAYRAAGAR